MNLDKKFRAYFITAILLFSILSFVIITPTNSKAILLEENATLYFHGSLTEEVILDQNISTKSNDTAWPPKITDYESLVEWVSLWAIYGLMENESDPMEAYFNELMEITYGGPLSISGTYYNTYSETVEIEGDVTFDLYFSSNFISKLNRYQDSVKVSLYAYGESDFAPTMIKNVTADINSELLKGGIQKTQITIKDVDYELKPDENLLFLVKIIPVDRPISKYIEDNFNEEKFRKSLENISEWLTNDSMTKAPILRNITEKIIDWVLDRLEYENNVSYFESLIIDAIDTYLNDFEGNMTDIAPDVVSALRASSFIYDSAKHPSSVSLTFKPKGLLDDDNVKIYYLHSNGEMDATEPTGTSNKEIDLSTNSGEWDSDSLNTSKILKEADASIYFDYKDIVSIVNLLRGKITVSAELYDDYTLISSSEKELDRTRIFDFLNEEEAEPLVFSFYIPDNLEIQYDHKLSLKVLVKNETRFGKLGVYRYLKLLYDSKECNSYLSVIFEDTTHIRIEDINGETPDGKIEQKIAANDDVKLAFNIASDYDDDIYITYDTDDSLSNWDIDYPDGPISVSADKNTIVYIYINSTHTSINSYGQEIDLNFKITGKTGRASQDVTVEISEDAVVHNVDFNIPDSKKIKPGKYVTYQLIFENNNTGYWPEDYTIDVISEHDFDINLSINDDYHTSRINNVRVNEKVKINITLYINKDTKAKSDVLTIYVNASSGENYKLYINTTISEDGILAMIYGFFESVAESLGLDSVLGEYAALFLIFLLVFIILFFIIIIIYLTRKKHIELICTDRIKVIPPDGKAEYEITIRNPSRHTLNYNIYADSGTQSWVWNVEVNPDSIIIEPKQSKTIIMTVKPTDLVKANDWIEAKLVVRTLEKQKTSSISTVTTIADEKPNLEIVGDLKHSPSTFNEGDLVTTSLKLENKGKVASKKVTIILYVNGEEKNKVEDITIPSGGYAEIEIPWIAVKGKNEVNVVID